MQADTSVLNTPTYTISSFHFKNFKGIKELDLKNLPDNASWIFLTGENGFGKTSILQAIAASLLPFSSSMYTFDFEDSNLNITVKNWGTNPEKRTTRKEKGSFDFRSNRREFDYLACYGSSRLDTYTESSAEKARQNSIANLFDSRTLLENIEHQLTRWYAKKKDEEFAEKYKRTKQILIDILQIKDILIDFRTDKISYIELDDEGESYKPLPLHQLASGYRSLIAMIGDMILKLMRTQPNVHDPQELEGIILIDELDLHFHPKWQKRLPPILSKTFPKIQFVASTHSPIPFLGAPPGSVFLTVNRSSQAGITIERIKHLEDDIHKLTPNLLLNSPIFGYADLFSSRFDPGQEILTEDTFSEVAFNKEIEQRFLKELPEEKQNQLRKLLKKQ